MFHQNQAQKLADSIQKDKAKENLITKKNICKIRYLVNFLIQRNPDNDLYDNV